MKTISVGELRRDPTRMFEDVAEGATYRVTRRNREIALIVPILSSATIVPAKRRGPARTSELPRVELTEGMDLDAYLDELKGEW